MSELCTPPSARKRKKTPILAEVPQRKKRSKLATSHTPWASSTFVDNSNSFVEEGTSIKRRRLRPNSSTSNFDAVIELDSSSDTDRIPPLKIFLSHSKRTQKDVQPLRKRIRAGNVIDLCSSDDTVSMERRDNSSRVPKRVPSSKKATSMIKSREVIVLSSGDEVEIQGCQYPRLDLDRKRASRNCDSSPRTSAHTIGNELPGPKSGIENDFVNSSVDRPETEHIAMTQEFFNSLYKDALKKPPADVSMANKMFCPHLFYGFKSPRVVRKLPREATEQPETPDHTSLKSESKSFFTRVISALNRINDRTCNSSRASLVRGPEHETCSVHVSEDEETKRHDETLGSSEALYPEVVGNPVNPISVTITQVTRSEDKEDRAMGQREGVTGTMTTDSEVSGPIKKSSPVGQDELMLAAAHISPIFRICDPSIFALEHLPKLTWPILLGHKSKNT